MKKIFLLVFTACLLVACGSEEKPETKEAPAQTQTQPAVAGTENPYPGYPQERVKLLFDSCDYVDVIFFQESFSINQHTQKDIRGMLNYISQNTPKTLNPACQPIGRIFFQIDGRNEASANIFFQQECLYFLFLEDEKPVYANGFTESGVNFFNNIFAQVNSQKKAMQQQQGQ
jgi:hypothetical protein